MKILLLVMINLGCFGAGAYCQTFSEWWRQNKTRLKYLHKQVAALEEIKETTEDGYSQTEEGLDTITVIRKEEFLEHDAFIQSLRTVKYIMRDGPELVNCYAMVATLAHVMNKRLSSYRLRTDLNLQEIEWVSRDVQAYILEMRAKVRQLEELTRDGAVEMEDSQRNLKIIDIEFDVRGGYESGIGFLRRVEELIVLRKQQAANDNFVKAVTNENT